MKFAHFFVDRPIFASVVSLITVLIGMIAYFNLPVSQYPEIVPPTIVVRAAYPGADAETIAVHGRDATRAGDQRRRGHAVHVVELVE